MRRKRRNRRRWQRRAEEAWRSKRKIRGEERGRRRTRIGGEEVEEGCGRRGITGNCLFQLILSLVCISCLLLDPAPRPPPEPPTRPSLPPSSTSASSIFFLLFFFSSFCAAPSFFSSLSATSIPCRSPPLRPSHHPSPRSLVLLLLFSPPILYTLCIMPRESHQNEAGRSHRPVAFYLMKLQEYPS